MTTQAVYALAIILVIGAIVIMAAWSGLSIYRMRCRDRRRSKLVRSGDNFHHLTLEDLELQRAQRLESLQFDAEKAERIGRSLTLMPEDFPEGFLENYWQPIYPEGRKPTRFVDEDGKSPAIDGLVDFAPSAGTSAESPYQDAPALDCSDSGSSDSGSSDSGACDTSGGE